MASVHWAIQPVLALFVASSVLLTGAVERSPPSFVVDLDKPAYERWNSVIDANPDLGRDAPEIFKILTGNINMSNDTWGILFLMAEKIHKRLPAPFKEELQGMADRAKMPISLITLINLAYDLTAHCTSVVSTDANGTIWHGRNLDYNATTYLEKYTVHVDFKRGGKVAYSGVTFAGFAGMLTAIKPHAFTFSSNERDVGSFLENLLEMMDPNSKFLMVLIREVLEEAKNFREAISKFSLARMPAAIYVILGGLSNNEGVVLTRNRTHVIHEFAINMQSDRWYVLQTNHDPWLGDPWYDNRREAGETAMNRTGRNNITVDSLYDVLSVPKTRNKYTVYSTVMSASHPEAIRTWIRNSTELIPPPPVRASASNVVGRFGTFAAVLIVLSRNL
ncbi:hypothetical protein RvY_17261 [Ramazzottius varieornatus]|uniref:N-acylethanolamine-hydrolyzing acid amidase n=1 Tax=Ramazzottius varieornatus TaxID=947166 RepID=A0A1D1W2C8_RAMVA|nr:hypothetical protein RvY_17261 [Ramazzottius varieornatus]